MTAITAVLKTDLAFTNDFKVADNGDLDTMSGLVNIRNAILHRIITVPGTLAHRPNYGVGLPEFKGAPPTLAVQRQLAVRLREQLPLDDRIEAVTGVSVSYQDVSEPDTITIVVKVKLVGYGDATFDFTPFVDVRL